MNGELEQLVEMSKQGNQPALERLIGLIQDQIYGLAVRMLFDPNDDADASQEILLKLITHLGSFRGESASTTWMYRVAANHLLAMRRCEAEKRAMTVAEYEKDLDLEAARNWRGDQDQAWQKLWVEEIRISAFQSSIFQPACPVGSVFSAQPV